MKRRSFGMLGLSWLIYPFTAGQSLAGVDTPSLKKQIEDFKKRVRRYRRPYGGTAPWNIKVNGLPRLKESRKASDLLWLKSPNREGNFNLSFDAYTYPVYHAVEATGVINVRTKWSGNLDGKRIPWNATWTPAPGNDRQVIILDAANGREWNLFQVKVRGSTLHATNGNLVPGDYRSRTKGYPPSRGIGIPYLAMLVRPEEIAGGRIAHALSMPVSNPSGRTFVAPATKLENATGRGGIPIGMRFAIDVTEKDIQTWVSRQRDFTPQLRHAAVVIARALRDYGWFVTDNAGSASFQFEANVSAAGDWYLLGLSQTGSNARVFPRDLLDGLITRDRVYAIAPSNYYTRG
ncbi:hypothetical protein C1J03_15450 [Sulfitobacter sp. SK012]|nr:hypothetical protein C1J03_15450 [Sulfitobacter sp. SK012]